MRTPGMLALMFVISGCSRDAPTTQPGKAEPTDAQTDAAVAKLHVGMDYLKMCEAILPVSLGDAVHHWPGRDGAKRDYFRLRNGKQIWVEVTAGSPASDGAWGVISEIGPIEEYRGWAFDPEGSNELKWDNEANRLVVPAPH